MFNGVEHQQLAAYKGEGQMSLAFYDQSGLDNQRLLFCDPPLNFLPPTMSYWPVDASLLNQIEPLRHYDDS
jgi:hypothetical protein